ncbi:MAG: hypothetical protein LBV34_02870 [Nocardiopsaceae bacterium]|nr:hypothetical protein [Nocardiopsaceae bacterium]
MLDPVPERITYAEHHLGWSPWGGSGHLRFVAALMVRRLHRNTQLPGFRG